MTDDLMTPASRQAMEHYLAMADDQRRAAAADRAEAERLGDTDEGTARFEIALDRERSARAWQALADELAAFAEQAAPHDGGTLL